MAFVLSEFPALRPYLYHLTARENVPRVRASGRLEPAADLLRRAGRGHLAGTRRSAHRPLPLAEGAATLRGQAPLHAGNIAFEGGWTLRDLVVSLNGRVFFWPGTADRPSAYGRRHYERYRAEGPAVLRVPTAALLAANPEVEPEFCAFNSGSPRCTGGAPSPRGPGTFAPAAAFARRAAEVVEVTFPAAVRLPAEAQLGPGPGGPWQPLA